MYVRRNLVEGTARATHTRVAVMTLAKHISDTEDANKIMYNSWGHNPILDQ